MMQAHRNSGPQIRLAIPCFRETERLPPFLSTLLERVRGQTLPISIQVVDDGSPSAEREDLISSVTRMAHDDCALLPPLAIELNRGKGHAIRAAWNTPGPEPWLAFVDADGAIPPDEVLRFLSAGLDPGTSPALLCAIRESSGPRSVKRRFHRKLGGWIFHAWVKLCLGLQVKDTQCGLKMLPRAFYEERKEDWREERFAFDLELLLAARKAGLPVHAEPVAWSEKGGSRLGIGQALALFRSVWRLRRSL